MRWGDCASGLGGIDAPAPCNIIEITIEQTLVVIVISKILKRHSKAENQLIHERCVKSEGFS